MQFLSGFLNKIEAVCRNLNFTCRFDGNGVKFLEVYEEKFNLFIIIIIINNVGFLGFVAGMQTIPTFCLEDRNFMVDL